MRTTGAYRLQLEGAPALALSLKLEMHIDVSTRAHSRSSVAWRVATSWCGIELLRVSPCRGSLASLACCFLRSSPPKNERRGLATSASVRAGWLDAFFWKLKLRRNAVRPLAGRLAAGSALAGGGAAAVRITADLLGAAASGGSAETPLQAAGRAPRVAGAGLSCALVRVAVSQASSSADCGLICERGDRGRETAGEAAGCAATVT